jgi:hypothetical protein
MALVRVLVEFWRMVGRVCTYPKRSSYQLVEIAETFYAALSCRRSSPSPHTSELGYARRGTSWSKNLSDHQRENGYYSGGTTFNSILVNSGSNVS